MPEFPTATLAFPFVGIGGRARGNTVIAYVGLLGLLGLRLVGHWFRFVLLNCIYYIAMGRSCQGFSEENQIKVSYDLH